MLQKQYNDMALKVNQLERFTNQLKGGVNDLIDKVQDNTSVCSRSDKSFPGVIDTDKSTSDYSDLSTAQALIASLTVSLIDTEKNRYTPLRDRPGPGGRSNGRGRGRGGREGEKCRPQGVLGPVNENVDRPMTRNDDGRTEKKNKKTNCTATPMGTNVSTATTVVIACTRKKDTNHVPRLKIQWEVVYSTNDSLIIHASVGREKGVVK